MSASTIGPNVSIGTGATVDQSALRDTIVGAGARVANSRLSSSLVGDSSVVEGAKGQINVADHSVVKIEV